MGFAGLGEGNLHVLGLRPVRHDDWDVRGHRVFSFQLATQRVGVVFGQQGGRNFLEGGVEHYAGAF